MVIYEVWDHDPMDGSMGRNYIAARYTDKTKADADAQARNCAARKHFESVAFNGMHRAEKEPWNWQFSYVREATVEV